MIKLIIDVLKNLLICVNVNLWSLIMKFKKGDQIMI